MQVLVTGFIDNLSFNKDENDLTKIDISGLHYSQAYSFPSEAAPHLLVIAHRSSKFEDDATLVVEFIDSEENVLARNVQPFPIDKGLLGYRLVKANFEVTREQLITTKISIPQAKIELEIPLNIKEGK